MGHLARTQTLPMPVVPGNDSKNVNVTFKEASEVNAPLLATIPTKYLK